MAEQADGNIFIGTELNTEGFKAGSIEMLTAIKSLSEEIKALGATLKGIFKEPFTPNINTDDAEKDIAELKAQAKELNGELSEPSKGDSNTGTQSMDTPEVNVDSTVQKASGLQRQIESVKLSIERLEPTCQKAMLGSESAMTTFEGKASALESKIADLQSKLNTVGQTQYPTQEYEELCAEVEKAGQKLESLLNKQEKMQSLGVKENSAQWKNLQYDLDMVGQKYDRLEAAQKRLESSGAAFKMGVDTTQYAQMESALSGAKAKLDEMRASESAAKDRMAELAAEADKARENVNFLQKVSQGVKSAFSKMGTAIKNTLSGVKKQTADAGNVINTLSKKITGLWGIFKRMAIRKIMSSMLSGLKDGMNNLAQYSAPVNANLSALKSSLIQLKNSLAAAFAPILTVVTPALQTLIGYISRAVSYIGMLFATLSGSSTFTVATAVQEDYAGSINDTTEAAKEAKKQLAGFDELNVLSDNSSLSSSSYENEGVSPFDMFEEVPLPEGLFTPFVDAFANIFSVFKSAWENEGQNTINAIRTAFDGIKVLLSAIGASFAEVWTNGTGQEIVEAILRIFQNILLCIGNIGTTLADAWNANNNGTIILQSILGIFNSILGLIDNLSSSTADWFASLNLTPLMTSVASLTTAAQPLIDTLGDAFTNLYEDVLQPVAGWVIEEAAPASINVFSNALTTLKDVLDLLEPLGEWLWDKFLEPISEWAGDVFIDALDTINDLLTDFNDLLEGNTTFGEFLDKLSLGETILLAVATAVGVVVAAIGIWNVIGAIATGITTALGVAINILTSPITLVIAAIAALIAIGILLYQNWDEITEWLKKLWGDIKSIASTVWNSIKDFFVGLWNGIKNTAISVWNGIKNGIMTVVNGIKDGVTAAFNKVKEFISRCFNGIKTTVSDIWNGIWNTIKGVINGILGGIESMVNGVIKGLNFMINALNKLSFDIPDWVPIIGGKKFGFNIKNISEISIPRLAEGGLVRAGQLFVARESGPELVGRSGGKSAVMNNDQIVDSVSRGVADAVSDEVRGIDRSVDGISGVVENVHFGIVDKLQAIARSVAFRTPAAASSLTPYKVAAAVSGAVGGDINNSIDANNDELINVIVQGLASQTSALVSAIENNRPSIKIDKSSLTDAVIGEINRRTRMTNRSPLIG